MSKPPPDFTPLPNVTGVAFVFVVYPQNEPRRVLTNGQVTTHTEAVEILVGTDGPIPPRGRAPVLFVGQTPVTEVQALGENLYAFIAYEHQSLNPGEALSLRWNQPSDEVIQTPFKYQPPPTTV